ncbi:hypothetical protein SAMN04488117_108162 [Celeribacter baekdonensis]|uniref:Uncharacterized protein n=1 Tax=Celeribacter baekdonensis TaxID=875171 RepID=A0A1G7PUI8_9RHOB|nr:hypothetical protein SAMN04488117_108162 [Celeribacter baekdonensis]
MQELSTHDHSLHNQTYKMSQRLSWFRPPLLPKTLTTDTLWLSILSRAKRKHCSSGLEPQSRFVPTHLNVSGAFTVDWRHLDQSDMERTLKWAKDKETAEAGRPQQATQVAADVLTGEARGSRRTLRPSRKPVGGVLCARVTHQMRPKRQPIIKGTIQIRRRIFITQLRQTYLLGKLQEPQN